MRRNKRRQRSRRVTLPEVSLTPLIDTALTLLVIFMITAPMVQNGIKVNLPSGRSREVGAQQELVVSVSERGEIFFNNAPVTAGQLTSAVKTAMEGRDQTPVYVRADKAITYGQVMSIVDELKAAGVQFVAMSTQNAGSGG